MANDMWNSHHWIGPRGRRVEIEPGKQLIQHHCTRCERDFVEDPPSGERYAVCIAFQFSAASRSDHKTMARGVMSGRSSSPGRRVPEQIDRSPHQVTGSSSPCSLPLPVRSQRHARLHATPRCSRCVPILFRKTASALCPISLPATTEPDLLTQVQGWPLPLSMNLLDML